MRDITKFKERFQRWKKTGELPYEAGRIKNADSNREELVYEDSLSLSALPAYEGGKDGTILNHDYANDVFTGARLFDGQDIVVTGHRRPKPFKWVSPKGAGNMTVMPGDPEMAFFAPIAIGAGIAASPALSGLVSNVAAPGSAFWTSPITKQLMVGTAAAEGVNKATKAITGYNSVGEGVGASVEKATGWNPNSTLVGQLATEAFNPGWYLSPNGVLNTAGKVSNAMENLPNLAKNTADKLGFFVQKPGTFTRGIGFGEEGLQDLITTGVVRGNVSQRPLATLDFSDPSGRNRIEEMMYSPVLAKSKELLMLEQSSPFGGLDVATDPYVYLYNKSLRRAAAPYLDQIVDKPTPQEVIDIFNNSVLPRLLFMRPGYRGGLMYPTVKSRVDHTLSRGYTVYPKELFEKARGNDITVGLHYPETGHIGIKEGYEDFAGGHEFRHRLDKFLMKTDTESDILEAAYDDDFLKLSSLYDDLKDVRMGPEAVTTNFDARNAAIGKYHAANTDWKLLNKMIDKLSDEKIIEAVEKSNGYGRAYIDYLRKNNKLTSTKIHQFREAMKFVGMFAGAAPLLNPSKQK